MCVITYTNYHYYCLGILSLLLLQAHSQGGFEGDRSNPPFDQIHAYIIQVNIHAYIYMSIRANQVPTQGSAETVLLHSNSKITLLATRISLVLPLGTHFFVALVLLIWRAWPNKVGVVVKISRA